VDAAQVPDAGSLQSAPSDLPGCAGRGEDRGVQTLHGPAAVLAATNGHPYARFGVSLSDGADVRGVTDGDAVAWAGRSPYGWVGHGLGDVSTVVGLVGRTDLFRDARWINLPRHEPRAGYVRNEEWDLLWATGPVPPQPGGDRVVPIADDAAIAALLDVAFPGSGVRPGSPHVLGWYGIWADGSLVACAADRSTSAPGIGPVGLVGGVAVHPEHRRPALARRSPANWPGACSTTMTWSRSAWTPATARRSGCTSGWASPAATR
jgi:hypothetical protein